MTGVRDDFTERVKLVPGHPDRIAVRGPAIVQTPNGGSGYEITTDTDLQFPARSEVFIKVWPEENR